MTFATIIEKILEHGGPAMLVAVAFLWYLHRQTEKKDAALAASDARVRELTRELIDDKTAMLQAAAETREVVSKLVDKSASTDQTVRTMLDRLSADHDRLSAEITALRTT